MDTTDVKLSKEEFRLALARFNVYSMLLIFNRKSLSGR